MLEREAERDCIIDVIGAGEEEEEEEETILGDRKRVGDSKWVLDKCCFSVDTNSLASAAEWARKMCRQVERGCERWVEGVDAPRPPPSSFSAPSSPTAAATAPYPSSPPSSSSMGVTLFTLQARTATRHSRGQPARMSRIPPGECASMPTLRSRSETASGEAESAWDVSKSTAATNFEESEMEEASKANIDGGAKTDAPT